MTNGPNQYARAWQYDSIGNMTQRVEQGVTTTYSYDANHDHAVKQAGANYFCYDANGNMYRRNATTSSCTNGDTLSYDVENRLTQVIKGATTTTNFAYNGDGARVKREVVGTGTTFYIGNYFEVYVPNGGSATFNKYYYFGSQRVAAKIAGTLFYLQGDHLGSSSVVMTQAGTSFYSRQTYYPYGAQRTTEGSPLPIDYTFTGQKSDDSTGLMFYGARYYDTSLGRFTQPDTLVPSPLNPQSLNRFSYVLNNPVKYSDPTGHAEVCDDPSCGANPPSNPSNNGETPTAPTAPPASPPVDSPTNPNPEQGDDCKRHCDDADVADSRYAPATNTPLLMAMAPRGNMCAFCAYRATTATAMGPIDDPGNGNVAGVGSGFGIGYAIAQMFNQAVQAVQSRLPVFSAQPITVKVGEFVNRTYDSRWFPGAQGISGPLGRSFSPGSGVPTTASEAIVERGLGIWSANNSEIAVVYRAVQDIPALSRTALFGKAPEVLIEPQYFEYLQKMFEYPLVR